MLNPSSLAHSYACTRIPAHAHASTCTHTHTHMVMRTHIHAHTCMHTHTHMVMRTHTRPRTRPGAPQGAGGPELGQQPAGGGVHVQRASHGGEERHLVSASTPSGRVGKACGRLGAQLRPLSFLKGWLVGTGALGNCGAGPLPTALRPSCHNSQLE